ncbi:MAG: ACT domain-containing protein [Firmicutes bacterium]|nr:ACT domain-containing protein [Bacillota bacterium]
MDKLVLTLLPHLYGVYRLDSDAVIDFPEDPEGGFISVTRTVEELSVVCREELLPLNCTQEKGFRLFKVEGPLDFSLTGILASLLNPLAVARIAVFTLSTYDTDYLMIKAGKLDEAISALGTIAKIAH